MTAEKIFNLAMDLVGKRAKNGVIDANKTASYRVVSPGILTLWQSEMSKKINGTISSDITNLSQTIEVDDYIARTGAYFLASHLMLVEDPDSASYFLQKYQELKVEASRKQPKSAVKTIDVYGVGVYYGTD